MAAPAFLDFLSSDASNSNRNKPRVTLTFAQSLDAKIAGSGGKQLILSGRESMIMTHWLRSFHDAILVGIGTALNDDPQLNIRHLPPPPSSADQPRNAPRPILLDSSLRCSTDCKLLLNYQKGVGRRPWIFAAESSATPSERQRALEKAGAKIFYIPTQEGKLHIPALLQKLAEQNVRSLMVEGGATVIRAFSNEPDIVDNLIITVAPTMVGDQGIGYDFHAGDFGGQFQHLSTNVVGQDSVVVFQRLKS